MKLLLQKDLEFKITQTHKHLINKTSDSLLFIISFLNKFIFSLTCPLRAQLLNKAKQQIQYSLLLEGS